MTAYPFRAHGFTPGFCFGGVRVAFLFTFLCFVAFLFFVYLRFVSSALNVVSVSGLLSCQYLWIVSVVSISGLLMLSVSLDC
jgi:hypothetical protein